MASALESVATILALLVGAVWAYYKFIKDRIYRPRFDITIDAGTLTIAGNRHLMCRLTVKNIGTSKIRILQRGTGLRVSTGDAVTSAFEEPQFTRQGVWEVLLDHEWIESGETVRHELLLGKPGSPDQVCLIEARLVCKQPRHNVAVGARKILPLSEQWGPPNPGREAEE